MPWAVRAALPWAALRGGPSEMRTVRLKLLGCRHWAARRGPAVWGHWPADRGTQACVQATRRPDWRHAPPGLAQDTRIRRHRSRRKTAPHRVIPPAPLAAPSRRTAGSSLAACAGACPPRPASTGVLALDRRAATSREETTPCAPCTARLRSHGHYGIESTDRIIGGISWTVGRGHCPGPCEGTESHPRLDGMASTGVTAPAAGGMAAPGATAPAGSIPARIRNPWDREHRQRPTLASSGHGQGANRKHDGTSREDHGFGR